VRKDRRGRRAGAVKLLIFDPQFSSSSSSSSRFFLNSQSRIVKLYIANQVEAQVRISHFEIEAGSGPESEFLSANGLIYLLLLYL